ncbi:hypothetical protein GCM10023074_17920 [Microbispora amethystogenes]|uniref:Uncharacterized protein n=1 Tax=Microbispora amethystogenes TaxID=1427754 RepID=A0ABQ4F6Q9_9ACTN|nr:hypothetical protein Mam01_06490 [Microbispora amethystogenes]
MWCGGGSTRDAVPDGDSGFENPFNSTSDSFCRAGKRPLIVPLSGTTYLQDERRLRALEDRVNPLRMEKWLVNIIG